jgi:CheY-like chemotaxis protein
MEAQPYNSLPNWEDKTILIGEDEPVNFKLLEMILQKTKVRLLHGNTGLEVIQILKGNPQVAIILMDIKMPDLDGLEATQEIRKFNPDIPIIAQTAYALEEEKTKCMESGFNGYVTKPINRKLLINLIQSFIE